MLLERGRALRPPQERHRVSLGGAALATLDAAMNGQRASGEGYVHDLAGRAVAFSKGWSGRAGRVPSHNDLLPPPLSSAARQRAAPGKGAGPRRTQLAVSPGPPAGSFHALNPASRSAASTAPTSSSLPAR